MEIVNRLKIRKINRAIGLVDDIELLNIQDDIPHGLFRFNFQQIKNGKTIYGNGFSLNESEALLKAWAEFVERQGFHQEIEKNEKILTSNGFAAHTKLELSKLNSYKELIERDCLLSSWLLGLSAKPFEPNKYGNRTLKSILKDLDARGFRLRFGILGENDNYLIGIVIIKKGDFITAYTSCKSNLKELAHQLVVESLCVANAVKQDTKYIENQDLLYSPMDHQSYYCSKDRHSHIESLIDPNQMEIISFPKFNYQVQQIQLDNKLDQQSNFYVTRAISEECQNLWFGKTEEKNVNLDRIKIIAKKEVSYESLNTLPHPLV